MPGHAPLLGILAIGIMKVREAGNSEFRMFVDRGFFKISHEGVTIIAQSAEPQDQIDTDRAIAARERAKNLLASRDPGIDMERAKYALLRAETRINVAEGAVYYLIL